MYEKLSGTEASSTKERRLEALEQFLGELHALLAAGEHLRAMGMIEGVLRVLRYSPAPRPERRRA